MASSVREDTSSNDWSCTQTRGDRIEFQWTIKKFHLLPEKNGELIYSPIFPTNSTEQWTIDFYPQGCKEENVGWISVYLSPASDRMLGIGVNCEMTVFRSDKILKKAAFVYKFEKIEGYGSSKLVERSKLSVEDDPTDAITIRCKIEVLGTYITSSSEEKFWDMGLPFEVRKNRLTEDFQSFYEDPEWTDFTIISGHKKFQIHKAILAIRSPVFATMLEHKEVEENAKNELIIENIKPAIVERLLEFIYTDNVSEIGEFAPGLLAAAEKYELEGLRNLCEESLYKTLNEDNAAELLILADSHNANQLKKYIIQFIVAHAKKVFKLEAFKSLELSKELYKEIIYALTFSARENSFN